jgi:hypothetical protein
MAEHGEAGARERRSDTQRERLQWMILASDRAMQDQNAHIDMLHARVAAQIAANQSAKRGRDAAFAPRRAVG